jgi:hypothetical protein
MLEKYLVLNKYFLSLFGVNEFKDLQNKLRDVEEGTDDQGITHFVNVLKGLEGLKISEDDLDKYDKNIQKHVKEVGGKRGGISLKYFQYLAVLFTEIFLDKLKNKKKEFLYELNEFLKNYKDEKVKEILKNFTEQDLKKLAFWMATGSGKTIILHINYYQFLDYKLFEPKNIILITPNEGLSKQHYEELIKSGIPARMYVETPNRSWSSENEVLVIEITKFVEEKKGRGLSIPVNAFESENLIFVDEGHKGKKSEEQSWANLRNKLGENGFVFEYSATFGQILSEKNKETLKEYGKSIIFDYSYRYFYLDGYGKDFYVFNAKDTKLEDKDFQETMFVANLLSFYEQMLFYTENSKLAKEYNIEKPLWIFVGTTVSGGGNSEETDILTITLFLRKAIEDEKWLKDKINSVLQMDIFKDRFENIDDIYKKVFNENDNIYTKVFNGKGRFYIYEIKNAEGELGLRVGDNPYFGVINIGDVNNFKKLLASRNFEIEQDAISSSLFDDIKRETSNINILIGSKKFIEGWDTWRVSSMGLLNMGKGEGPQIIQLFGRGVRIKGKDMSLKRSGKEELKVLETLNIFSIKADYLNKFLEAIQKEEADFEKIKVPVKSLSDKWKDLPYLVPAEDKKFVEYETVFLKKDDKIRYVLDLTPKITEFIGTQKEESKIDSEEITFDKFIDLLDWDNIEQEIYQYKRIKDYWNLLWSKQDLKEVLSACKVKGIKEKEALDKIQEIAVLLLKGYIEKFYNKKLGEFERKNLTYRKAGEQLSLFSKQETVEYYTVYVDKRKQKLIQDIKSLINNSDELLKDDKTPLPRICFNKHIYVPLLLDDKNIDKVLPQGLNESKKKFIERLRECLQELLLDNKNIDKISPQGLNESEKKFIEGLREYLQNNEKKFSDYEIFLLRNEPKSGIGFQLGWGKFYPDFIMWIKGKDKTYMVFIDPKGLMHTKDLNDEKILFNQNELKEVDEYLKKVRSDVSLLSFILSYTKYDDLIKGMKNVPNKEDYERNNVIFMEDPDWCNKIFDKILKN